MNEHETNQRILAFDIGGSAIKTATVDVTSGKLLTPSKALSLPQPPDPKNVLDVLRSEIERVGDVNAVGVGYPGVIVDGRTMSAAHMDMSFIGVDFLSKLRKLSDKPVGLINDADAAGLAEMAFGAGRDLNHSGAGSVLMLTLGTGIGSALFHGGRLFPNTEFGHIELDGAEAEDQAAASVKTEQNLDWPVWSVRVNRYLAEMDKLVSPVRIIIGGGISENFARFEPYLKTRCKVVPASLGNAAGLIGAALNAREQS